MVVPNHRAVVAHPARFTRTCVPGSVLYTDALRSYRQADRDYIHALHRPFARVRGRPRSHEHHRELLVVREADAARDVYRAARLPPQCLPGRIGVPLQQPRATGRGRLEETIKGVEGRRVTYKDLTKTHKLWRLRPGRAARPLHGGRRGRRTRCRTTRRKGKHTALEVKQRFQRVLEGSCLMPRRVKPTVVRIDYEIAVNLFSSHLEAQRPHLQVLLVLRVV